MSILWKGREVATAGELFDALDGLISEAEGQEFMRLYAADLRVNGVDKPESTAFANVGYVSRYGSDETFERVRSFTGAQHPIFG